MRDSRSCGRAKQAVLHLKSKKWIWCGLSDAADLSLLSLVFSTTCQIAKHGKMSAWTHRESNRRENK